MLLKLAIEIVDLPSYNMVIFHSFLCVYQRVYPMTCMTDFPRGDPTLRAFLNHAVNGTLHLPFSVAGGMVDSTAEIQDEAHLQSTFPQKNRKIFHLDNF